jgi:hypothetical protein
MLSKRAPIVVVLVLGAAGSMGAHTQLNVGNIAAAVPIPLATAQQSSHLESRTATSKPSLPANATDD